ncbi:hypothetical protein BGZ88_012547 [Linnemannia elongata]|nr:hypothetical protein BGZ88_012547 [Linnemannia elongata]
MDLPISKSKKRQNRRRKLRESRRESGEEADEEEAGYSHANEGESDTQDLSFDLAIPAITFKFNKAAGRARVDSLYPLYDSSCASSPSKTVNDVQSNVASRPQSNNYTTRIGSGRSQGTVVSNSVLPTELLPFLLLSSAHSSETDTSQETVVPAGVEFDRESDNRMEKSVDEHNSDFGGEDASHGDFFCRVDRYTTGPFNRGGVADDPTALCDLGINATAQLWPPKSVPLCRFAEH